MCVSKLPEHALPEFPGKTGLRQVLRVFFAIFFLRR
jgi:hypothetical protein